MNQPQRLLRELLKQPEGPASQAELAREIGVTPQFLGQVLKGLRKPGPRILGYLGLELQVRESYRKVGGLAG